MINPINEAVRKISEAVPELAQSLTGGQGKEEMYVPEIAPLCRSIASDGMVLLKNEKETLPLDSEKEVAVFGRCAWDFFSVGYGSGGDVMYPYKRNLLDGLGDDGIKVNTNIRSKYEEWRAKPINIPDPGIWGTWPMSYPEMPISEAEVSEAAARDETAIYVLGRAAGEDRDNNLKKGSYYIKDDEKNVLSLITKYFKKTVLILDCGNIIDLSFLREFGESISAILYAFPGGMEAGNALADVLTGKVSPSGKLTATIAKEYSDYPSAKDFGDRKMNKYTEDIFVGYRYFETMKKDRVLYPFGFGLSYTSFELTKISADEHEISISVKNTGKYAGKQTVLLFAAPPAGKLSKPSLELVGFMKTGLIAPDESEIVNIPYDINTISSFDDDGSSGHLNSFVLEKGEYRILAGGDVRDIEEVYSFTLSEDKVTASEQCCAPAKGTAFERLTYIDGKVSHEMTPEINISLKERIEANMPSELPSVMKDEYKWDDVSTGKVSVEEFVSSLSDEEIMDLCRGSIDQDYGDRARGNVGAFGGTTERLQKKGIPYAVTTDGPSGIRMKHTAALLPCGNLLACTFDLNAVKSLYALMAKEMQKAGSDVLLAPGMNIQRNPLCGRNFEYFSEDPLLSGLMGTAVVEGIQENGSFCCPKHFACNNQEQNRNHNDSRVSEKALREIYFRNFEIMVKKAHPEIMMSSYNMLNGIYNHYNYDLIETVLRKEWGFDGVILTDWWMQTGESPEYPGLKNDAYRVRSSVDVLMPGGDGPWPGSAVGNTLPASLKMENGLKKSELQRTAVRVVRFLLKLK